MGRPNKGKGKISRAELDKRLEECYDSLYERALALCSTTLEHDTQIVASTMLAQALRLYKTVLTEEDFTAMVASVADTADQIQPYRASKLH
jgi:hypothetical protein